MITILCIILGSATATLSVALFYAVRNNSQFRADIDEAFKKVFGLQDQAAKDGLSIAQLVHERDRLDDLFGEKVHELDAERQTVKVVEEQRDELLQALKVAGDPHAVAATIDAELDKLRKLSKTGN